MEAAAALLAVAQKSIGPDAALYIIRRQPYCLDGQCAAANPSFPYHIRGEGVFFYGRCPLTRKIRSKFTCADLSMPQKYYGRVVATV